jgi:UDP-N-acetylmuramoyl-L-alanyl-D-glutamate--2,6-diaminopimelate ligase
VTLRTLLEDSDVLDVTGNVPDPLATEVKGIGYDSRRIRAGEVFFGLAGVEQDGATFVRDALAKGAVAAVVGSGVAAEGATLVHVPEPRRALAEAAARFHGHPSRALQVVGVTGTNGKTTTTWMLESIFRAAGRTPGVIGTTGYRLGDETRPAPFTTPEAPELQALLAEMRDRGVQSLAMEVSSHALVQRRAYGVAFDVVAFTNLSHDHLDYHGTLEGYLDAKLMLFDGRNGATGKNTIAVVNVDDGAGARVIEAARRGGLPVIGYAAGDRRPREPDAVWVAGIAPAGGGLSLRVVARGHEHRLRLPLLGRYNAANAGAAYAAALALEIPERAIVRGLETIPAVPGRLERVTGAPFEIVVDYAHTPDALARALAAAREHARGRVLLVFGAGGDRDRAKRPVMGRVASEHSDLAWVTNDNPRREDPQAIADAIVAGAARPLRVELDRRVAIAAALAEARAGDIVVIAGKGHETTQTIGERVIPFDDRAVAAALIAPGSRA